MKQNKGHARCNAFGIRHVFEKEDFDYLILMDGDGEDRPVEIKNFIEELNERFGPPPNEVSNLIYTISLKIICLKLNINFIDIGPKALIIGFRKQGEKEISKILDWVNKNNNFIKLRNDEKIVITLKGKSVNRFKLLKDYLKEINYILRP